MVSSLIGFLYQVQNLLFSLANVTVIEPCLTVSARYPARPT